MKLTKVAVFYQNDDYGKQGLEGVERYEKEKNLKVAAAVSAEVTDRDLSSHALKLKEFRGRGCRHVGHAHSRSFAPG